MYMYGSFLTSNAYLCMCTFTDFSCCSMYLPYTLWEIVLFSTQTWVLVHTGPVLSLTEGLLKVNSTS